jgi:hypothetical protein
MEETEDAARFSPWAANPVEKGASSFNGEIDPFIVHELAPMTGKRHECAFRDHPSTWYWLEAWRRKAKHQLRIEPLCRYCQELGHVRPATIADHIEPVNGDWHRFWFGELQSLCKQCHEKWKRMEEKTEGGFRPGFDEYGNPLDPKHPTYAARSPSEQKKKAIPKKPISKKPSEHPPPIKIDLWI